MVKPKTSMADNLTKTGRCVTKITPALDPLWGWIGPNKVSDPIWGKLSLPEMVFRPNLANSQNLVGKPFQAKNDPQKCQKLTPNK